ncbi:hypothetical protein Q7P35_007087 [Cladosporium inversicolor]
MELTTTGVYKWAPLPSSRHTRLIQIRHSDSIELPIECTIITTCIDEPCKYRALSYAWGEIQQDGSHLNALIYCDGKHMRVTQHLNMALKRLRASTKTWYRKLPIWVDAISIAQDDFEEKAQQVLIISEIFGKCRHLTIWLGELGTRDEDEMCQRIATKFNQWENEGVEVELNSSEQAFFDTILERSWFQRRWIVQEVLVANTSGLTPFFRLGEYGWNWPFMAYITERSHNLRARDRFLLLARRMVNDSFIPGPFATPRNSARDVLDASGRPLYNSIIETLHIFEDAKCYDPRDRLYALLSMGWGPGKFSVDYTASVEDVYTDFASTLLRATSDDFLPAVLASASCRHEERPTAPQKLPSWVPNWRIVAHYASRTHQITVKRSISQVSRDPIHEFYGEARSVSSSNALMLHDVSLFSPCNHLPSESFARCGFCCLRRSFSTQTTVVEEPCNHSTSNEDCEECGLNNPLAAHAIRELAPLKDGQIICLLPKSHMALVLRPTLSDSLGDTGSYSLEHCLLVPLQDSVISVANYWDAQLALPRCDIAVV